MEIEVKRFTSKGEGNDMSRRSNIDGSRLPGMKREMESEGIMDLNLRAVVNLSVSSRFHG